MTKEELTLKLKYRLHILIEDCKLIRQCLDDGPEYNNLGLLERHLVTYRELCAKVKTL
jgi:hypothetical protein